jgi:hypothetical protein
VTDRDRTRNPPPAVLAPAEPPPAPWVPTLLGRRKLTPVAPVRRTRRKLWELPAQHHCTLLGAAFDPRELRQLFRRGPYADWERASDYALHSSAVHYAKERCDVTERMHRLLEERFGAAVAHLRPAASAAEVLERWRTWALADDPVAAYWAALTHPACDAQADELLAQHMHMLQHTGFAERRALARRLRDAHARIAELESTQARAIRLCDVQRDKLAAAQARAAEAERVARVAGGRSAPPSPAADAARLQALARENAALRFAVARLQRPRTQDRPDTGPQAAGQTPAPRRTQCDDAPAAPPAPVQLGRRRVLCVGGKPRLVPRYRALIEGAEGEFIHHDGGLEDHVARLPALLGAADAVICVASDCSHCAYFAVKRYCKRFGKPCVMLDNASVGALARSLGAVGTPAGGGART